MVTCPAPAPDVILLTSPRERKHSVTQGRRWLLAPITPAALTNQAGAEESPWGCPWVSELKHPSRWQVPTAGHTALQEGMLLGEISGEWATCTALSKASEQTVPPRNDWGARPGSASPSLSEETAAHTTRSPVLMWEAARSVFNRGIKQVYIPQRTREWHSFCLQMIICSVKKNKIKKEPTPK